MTQKIDNITWEKGLYHDTHDQFRVYSATGVDENGKEYIGEWVECVGEFVEIWNKEEA
jgi:hypothetical protein